MFDVVYCRSKFIREFDKKDLCRRHTSRRIVLDSDFETLFLFSKIEITLIDLPVSIHIYYKLTRCI
ncbi:hypothetical protein OC71_19845 [Pseudomonas sp. W15Feb9B]|nr:hypothetical protein OC71_19845 [Pseudomonas sp. W15Feb9B]